jgi:homoserine O-acetyltransferase
MIVCPDEGQERDVAVGELRLEAGATLERPTLRAWMWSSREDHEAFSAGRPLPPRPTALLLHGLTQGARAGGEGGFWAPLVGKGRPLRPWAMRLLSFNLLGSCRGSTGPADPGFPTRDRDALFPPPPSLVRGAPSRAERELPATVTPRDQAAAIARALDALGVATVDLVAGGSLGGMVATWLPALEKGRFANVLAIATPLASSAWMIGWNHVAREAILADPSYPEAHNGVAVARQVARLTYRSEVGLGELQGRRTAGAFDEERGARDEAWSPRGSYRVESYLRHAGRAFDFDARSYLALSWAMDHHDLARAPDFADPSARYLVVDIDSDRLVDAAAVDALARALSAAGARIERLTIRSTRGHDALFSEWGELTRVFRVALSASTPNPSEQ